MFRAFQLHQNKKARQINSISTDTFLVNFITGKRGNNTRVSTASSSQSTIIFYEHRMYDNTIVSTVYTWHRLGLTEIADLRLGYQFITHNGFI